MHCDGCRALLLRFHEHGCDFLEYRQLHCATVADASPLGQLRRRRLSRRSLGSMVYARIERDADAHTRRPWPEDVVERANHHGVEGTRSARPRARHWYRGHRPLVCCPRS